MVPLRATIRLIVIHTCQALPNHIIQLHTTIHLIVIQVLHVPSKHMVHLIPMIGPLDVHPLRGLPDHLIQIQTAWHWFNAYPQIHFMYVFSTGFKLVCLVSGQALTFVSIASTVFHATGGSPILRHGCPQVKQGSSKQVHLLAGSDHILPHLETAKNFLSGLQAPI